MPPRNGCVGPTIAIFMVATCEVRGASRKRLRGLRYGVRSTKFGASREQRFLAVCAPRLAPRASSARTSHLAPRTSFYVPQPLQALAYVGRLVARGVRVL